MSDCDRKRNYEMERIMSEEEEITMEDIEEDMVRVDAITGNLTTQVHKNMIMRNSYTPLTYVCRTGQVELAKIHIEMGADVKKTR